jgi:uncharacterized damage-inducible protein DinB
MKKSIQFAVAGLAIGMALQVNGLQAQMQMGGGGSAAMTTAQMDPAKALDKMLTGLEKEFVGVAEAMPADKYNFAPSADYFKSGATTDFKGVRTFGEQVAHVTQANYHYFSGFAAAPPMVDVAAIGKMTSKDDLVKALKDSFAYGHAAIATITAQNAFQVSNPKNPATPAMLAAGAVAHAFDHYGQLVEYLRMNGIVPPASAR